MCGKMRENLAVGDDLTGETADGGEEDANDVLRASIGSVSWQADHLV